MAGETTLTIVGNLTGDPELRFTPSGHARYALTDAGHAVLTPAGDTPPLFVAELTVPPGAGGAR